MIYHFRGRSVADVEEQFLASFADDDRRHETDLLVETDYDADEIDQAIADVREQRRAIFRAGLFEALAAFGITCDQSAADGLSVGGGPVPQP